MGTCRTQTSWWQGQVRVWFWEQPGSVGLKEQEPGESLAVCKDRNLPQTVKRMDISTYRHVDTTAWHLRHRTSDSTVDGHLRWHRYRITILGSTLESQRLEKITKITMSNHQPTPPMPISHVPQCHISTLLEGLQGQWLHHPLGNHLEHEPHGNATILSQMQTSSKETTQAHKHL